MRKKPKSNPSRGRADRSPAGRFILRAPQQAMTTVNFARQHRNWASAIVEKFFARTNRRGMVRPSIVHLAPAVQPRIITRYVGTRLHYDQRSWIRNQFRTNQLSTFGNSALRLTAVIPLLHDKRNRADFAVTATGSATRHTAPQPLFISATTSSPAHRSNTTANSAPLLRVLHRGSTPFSST